MELLVGEMVIMLDYPESKDWYVTEVSQLLHDRFVVNGFITREATMSGYRKRRRSRDWKPLGKSLFLGRGARTKAKERQQQFHRSISKGWSSTYGNGGSRSMSWISFYW